MTHEESPLQWDVFLSYNLKDQNAVREIAAYLHDEAKLQPWFDEWSLIPGDTLTANIHAGLAASKTAAVFIGPSGCGPWQNTELEEALNKARKRMGFRVIPVILPGVPNPPVLPPFLEHFPYVSLQPGPDNTTPLWRLECGVRGVPPGRHPPPRRTN